MHQVDGGTGEDDYLDSPAEDLLEVSLEVEGKILEAPRRASRSEDGEIDIAVFTEVAPGSAAEKVDGLSLPGIRPEVLAKAILDLGSGHGWIVSDPDR
jgi:hypothetical protein